MIRFFKIYFVSYQKRHCSFVFMLIVEIQPLYCVFKGLRVCGIVYYQTTAGIFKITGYKTFKSLLTSGVPELKAILFLVIADIFDKKVDADGCLVDGTITSYAALKESLMNLLMIAVLPVA